MAASQCFPEQRRRPADNTSRVPEGGASRDSLKLLRSGFLASLAAVTLLFLFALKVSRWATGAVLTLFYITLVVSICWGFANINLVKILGEPFTFLWLVYGDFLQNEDAKNAMGDAFNLFDLLIISASAFLVLALGQAAARLSLSLGPMTHRVVLAAVVVCFGIVLYGTRSYVRAEALPTAKIENPIIHFAESAMFNETPVVLTMKTNADETDVATVGERSPETSRFKAPSPNPIKNVLIFMMESVPARYVETFGGKYPVTPTIKSYAGSSIRFDNIYANAPSTNYTLFSLFSSMYNDISYYGMTYSHPYLRLDSISNILSERGFRTAFFWSADSRFQRVDEFLLNKGLDVVQDFRGQKCAEPTFKLSTKEWKNFDYISDFCSAQSISDWMNADPEKPFFGIMFTAMTHYPYIVNNPMFSAHASSSATGNETHYSGDEKFNAYLNALSIGDAALGKVLDSLKRSGRLDSTLVVVLGDHGEAFGEHGTYVHASALYDENVHIPLILINRHLFHDDVDHSIGGIVDVAPTILDVLGQPLPKSWQGRSLFSEQRPDRTFFFAPWNGYQFGYRQGDRKVLFNSTTGKLEQYDLKADPAEKSNLVGGDPEAHDALIQPIAQWVQSQRRRIAEMVALQKKNPPGCTATNLEFDAAGTSYQGLPTIEVLVNGKSVGRYDIPGRESVASTPKGIIAELQSVTAQTTRFKVDIGSVPDPQRIELRFVNDLWAGDGKGGDRNVFIKDIKVNGQLQSSVKFRVEEKEAGSIDDTGVSLYGNGSLWFNGPIIEGCG
ncbi:sulfatase-like hydrolase/transferase [Mesorhizobium sp. WSM4976]|uniref:sulfatase-like hydrolase/transferase n=1 Tax=Mesorhizobium sp. WSM4976 TaxID=3038549 RepID=UPI0024169561|nr:sulfatase-like hydrolase/transferase [Mesorhizobium sp. WSM4976]MDG4896234.1 sulfatase-like hydrolase/transferase [Mesorhizobium sp. WSM4976]